MAFHSVACAWRGVGIDLMSSRLNLINALVCDYDALSILVMYISGTY
jgi:hypothetical protein